MEEPKSAESAPQPPQMPLVVLSTQEVELSRPPQTTKIVFVGDQQSPEAQRVQSIAKAGHFDNELNIGRGWFQIGVSNQSVKYIIACFKAADPREWIKYLGDAVAKVVTAFKSPKPKKRPKRH